MAEVQVFAGPSACGLDAAVFDDARAQLLPPVRRGDIDRLVDQHPPGVAVVCDGVFQAVPAVSHAELCRAIDAGWQLWGVSSLGAIRAFELRHEGMHGFGHVYAMFERWPDFADDEPCLLHFPEPPYWPITEALVNVRFALERQKEALGISDRSERRLIEALRGLWFGDRTAAALRALMLEAGIRPTSADALLAWIQRHRVKTIDLAALMARRPWLGEPTPHASPTPGSG